MEELQREFKGIWIPADIWLSKELSIQEKVMLAEISSFEKNGKCFASNSYFAEFFGLSKSRVSSIISSLADKKLIEITLIYKANSFEVDQRIITTLNNSGVYAKTEGGMRENTQGVCVKTEGGMRENSDYITKTITKSNNKEKDIAKNLFPTNKPKKELKTNDVVTMKAMINVFSENEQVRERLLEYFNIRLSKGLKPVQWKIILDDLKTFTKGNESLMLDKITCATAAGHPLIIPTWEKNRQQTFSKPSFDNTAGREVQSAKTVQEVLARDEQGNLIKF